MSQKKSKWLVRSPRAGEAAGVDVYDGTQFVCQMSHHPAQRDQAAEYAARIVTCVNACEGVSTERLLAESVVTSHFRLWTKAAYITLLTAQRNELLDALERLMKWHADVYGDDCEYTGDHPLAVSRAAIARAKVVPNEAF